MKLTQSFSYNIISLIIILIIITTGSIPGYAFNNIIIEGGVCAIGLLSVLFTNYKQISSNILSVIPILLIVTIIQLIIYPQEIVPLLRFVLIFIFLIQLCIFAITKSINLVEIFYKIFLCLCIITTGVYTLVEIFNVSLPYFEFTNDWLREYKCYYYLYNSIITDFGTETISNITFVRNCGVFTEPGLFASFIIFELFIYLFIKKKKNILHLSVLLFALLTTFSTTGFIIVVVMIAYKFNRKFSSANLLKIIIVLLSLLAVFFFIQQLLLTKQEEHSFSFTARTFDFLNGLQLFLRSPLWGWGYKNADVFYSLQGALFLEDRGCSNGIVSLLYQLGLIGASLYYLPCIKLFRINKYSRNLYVMFLMVLFFSLFGQPFQFETGGIVIFTYMWVLSNFKKTVLFSFK